MTDTDKNGHPDEGSEEKDASESHHLLPAKTDDAGRQRISRVASRRYRGPILDHKPARIPTSPNCGFRTDADRHLLGPERVIETERSWLPVTTGD